MAPTTTAPWRTDTDAYPDDIDWEDLLEEEDEGEEDGEEDDDDEVDDEVDHAAEARKWKALARKHEQQAKANADKAKRLDELEEGNKSEIEKAASKAAEAEKRAEAAELRAVRLEIAAEKGLTPKQAKRLQGTSREELEADADELLEDFGSPDGDDGEGDTPGPSRRPRERLKPGAAPDAEPEENDPMKLAERIPRDT